MMRRLNILSIALLPLLLITSLSSAQYAIVPGEPPPLPESWSMEVDSMLPHGSLESITDLPGDVLDSISCAGEHQTIWQGEWSDVVRIEQAGTCYYFFLGEMWVDCLKLVNLETVSQISPSHLFFAAGGDGTGAQRGPVYVVDLVTGMMYCTTESGIWSCSPWIEGDYLLVEVMGDAPGGEDPWLSDSLFAMQWIDASYFTEAEGSTSNIALYHQGCTWMILPEDRYYSYRLAGTPESAAGEIIFDIAASANVIPQLVEVQTRAEFSAWIDSAGGYDSAFPQCGFRCSLDTDEHRIKSIQPLDPAMVVEGFLNSMRAEDYYGMLDYVSPDARSTITQTLGEDVRNYLHLYSEMDYNIVRVDLQEMRACVIVDVFLPGITSEISFELVRVSERWLIESL